LFNLARDLGVQEVEIRNDLPHVVSAVLRKATAVIWNSLAS
jgi:hypothetical protein